MEDAPRNINKEELEDDDDEIVEETKNDKKTVIPKSIFEKLMSSSKEEAKESKRSKLFELAIKEEDNESKTEKDSNDTNKELIDQIPEGDKSIGENIDTELDDQEEYEIIESVPNKTENLDEKDSLAESIKQILRRQNYDNNIIESDNLDVEPDIVEDNIEPPQNPNNPPVMDNPNDPIIPNGPNIPNNDPSVPNLPPVPPQNFDSNNQVPNNIVHNTIVNNPVEYHRSSPTAALLAVDYISHRINKNRTKKVEKELKSQIEIVKEKVQSNEKTNILKDLDTKKQQNEIIKKLEQYKKENEVPLSMNNNKEIYNRLNSEKLNKEHIIEEKNTIEKHLADPIIELKPVASFENTLETMNTAENSGIQNEFLYERRHEVKDVPPEKINSNQIAQPLNTGISDSRINNGYNVEKITRDNNPVKNKTVKKDDNVYQQAVMTGIWGAVLGLLIFIIIYIISNI